MDNSIFSNMSDQALSELIVKLDKELKKEQCEYLQYLLDTAIIELLERSE